MKKSKILLGVGAVMLGLALASNTVSAKEVKEKGNILYVVESGDSLSKIAEKYGVDFTVVHGNNEKEVEHADVIFKGQKLLVGGKDFDKNKAKEYSTVKPVESHKEVVQEVQAQEETQKVETPVTQESVQEEVTQEVAQEATQEVQPDSTSAPVGNDGSPLYAATAVANATGTSVDTWLYIINAESTNNPTALNSIGCYGYFQIHPVHGMPQGASVDTQIQYAIQVYNSSGFGAWEVM